jgi:hypothetical protein
MYVSGLMTYIEMEWDNIPESITPDMDLFFQAAFLQMECLPNAAGRFAEMFLKKKA